METTMILQVPGAMEALDFSVSSKSISTFKPGPCHERLATVLRQSTWAPPAWLSGQPTSYAHEASTRHHGTRTTRPCLQPLRILSWWVVAQLALSRFKTCCLAPGSWCSQATVFPSSSLCSVQSLLGTLYGPAAFGVRLPKKAPCFAFSMSLGTF